MFDCPCSAEWSPGEPGATGVLTLTGGIRSLRAVQSGEISLSQERWYAKDGAAAGRLLARDGRRHAWSMAFTEPGQGEAIEIHLLEETGRRPDGARQWQAHETLALWPVEVDGQAGTVRYVDILTDADGDGVGDVNEHLVGTSPEDAESVPDASQVDVLLLYTSEFADAEAGYPYTRLLHLMAVTSAFFEDSGTNIRLNTVGMSEVELAENG